MKNHIIILFIAFAPINIYSQNNNPRVSPVLAGALSNNIMSYVVGKIYVLPPVVVPRKTNEKEIVANNIKIYPNPVTNILTVETLDKSFVKSIEISEMTGKIIYSSNLENNTIDLSFLDRGFYSIKLDNDNTKTYKVIKK